MGHGLPGTRRRARTARRLEAEIRRLRGRVARLEREKVDVEAFAAMAAHELLEQLVMTEAYATAISDGLDDRLHAGSRRDLEALRRGAAGMQLLVETLLHDANGRRLRRRSVDLNRVLRDSVTRLEPQIRVRRADVHADKLPEVQGDETLIGALLTNLLVNALKYGPRDRGRILVGATLANGYWRITVQSHGPTIPAPDRKRIFEPYHRGRGERRAPGAGLGLTICRHIVERHGGQIGVSPVDGGNRFSFTLPA